MEKYKISKIKNKFKKFNLKFLNNRNFLLDLTGKTPAFFYKKKNISINNKLIQELIYFSKNNDRINCRICLHKNKREPIHIMLVLLNKINESPVHKHNDDETYNFIKGKFSVNIFKKKIKKKSIKISKNHTKVFRVEKNTFHNVVPIDKVIIFTEIRKNPY